MKTIILSLLLFISLNAQSELLLLMGDGEIIYNGTELITNEIDRTLESTLTYSSNFTSGVDGWAVLLGGAVAGNIDGISGQDNVLRFTNTSINNYHYFRRTPIFTQGYRQKLTLTYYLPSANTAMDGFDCYVAGSQNLFAGTTKDTWTTKPLTFTQTGTGTDLRIYTKDGTEQSYADTDSDVLYISFCSISRVSNYTTTGNHSFDTTTTYKQAGSYSGSIVASAAGNGTTNTISLASTLFTAVTSGTNYRFQVYAYTATANTTLTFKLGDIVLTNIVSTTGMSLLNFDFKATASSTGNILLYLDKAATVYLDEVSLKSGS